MTTLVLLFVFTVILFIISCFVKDIRIKKIISIISLVILCVISGTRNIGGTDYLMYKIIFKAIPTNHVISQIFSFCSSFQIEHGFYLYLAVIKNIGFNYYGFTLINSIVFYLLFYKVLKRYDYNITFILIIFLYKMFFYNTFISMRQPIAIIIFWLSLPYLKDKKYLYYFLTCIVAFLFHRSSIILFVVPLITHFKISKKTFLTLLIVGLISIVMIKVGLFDISRIIESILSLIFKNDSGGLSRVKSYLLASEGISILYVLEYYVIALLVYLYYDKIRNIDNNSEFFLKLFICLLPIYTIFSNITIATRLKDFFFLAYPIIIIYISKCLKKARLLLYLITIIVCFYGYIRYINNFDNGDLKNYNSYIFEDVSIFGSD